MQPSAAPPPSVLHFEPARTFPSTTLALTCAVHALVFAAAAMAAPMMRISWFGISAGLLSALHGAVAVLALARRPRGLAAAWVALSVCSLSWLLGVSWVVGSSVLYLSVLYQGIGRAVSVALLCIWGLVVLFTVPIACWGLAHTRPAWLSRRRTTVGVAAILLLALASAVWLRGSARASSVPLHDGVEQQLARAARNSASESGHSSLLHLTPADCEQPIDVGRMTLLVTALDRRSAPFTRCLQTLDGPRLGALLERLLTEHAHPETTIKLDLVRAVKRVRRVHPLLDALSIRPAIDGICSERRCLAPWQLVAMDAFTRFQPLEAVRDARFGVALDELARALGASPRGEPLLRIETESWVAYGEKWRRLSRLRPEQAASDAGAIARAVELANRHILAAQQPDGSFRYLLDPFTGIPEHRPGNLPRQAGTTLALCELAPGEATRAAAERALSFLANHKRSFGALAALSEFDDEADLGPNALPLIAFLSCRPLVGARYDETIGQLARVVMAMQRPSGGFFPELSPSDGPRGDHQPLYAAGQAVLSLVLMEQLLLEQPSPHWPDAKELSQAIERAMSYYGSDYWPTALRSLFYIEENWHCLAARAALHSHRHLEYEQFCLDYVRFKRRLILDDPRETSPEFLGGYGLGNMFPPHNTPTAGYGEALAAAIAVAHARGEDLAEYQQSMRLVLGFLLRQQWRDASCFACGASGAAVGGFSESSASPALRIDYVQHAMAALGHGARALSLTRR